MWVPHSWFRRTDTATAPGSSQAREGAFGSAIFTAPEEFEPPFEMARLISRGLAGHRPFLHAPAANVPTGLRRRTVPGPRPGSDPENS